jgi:hypothetical protein
LFLHARNHLLQTRSFPSARNGRASAITQINNPVLTPHAKESLE